VSAVRFARRALRDVDRIDMWWRDNRPAAPDLFSEELEDALSLLATAPTIGAPYDAPTRRPTRRLLLPDTQVHLYYRIEEDGDTVSIMRLWSARRGRGPSLQ
jgi:plasmid stabilization system protein ParE